MNKHTHVRTHWWHTSPQKNQILRLSVVCTDIARRMHPRKLELLTLSFFFILVFIFFLSSLCFLSLFSFWCLQRRHRYCRPEPKPEASPRGTLKIHTHIRITHDTISPQEKPWARTGRKTLENQDTIWHLWSLNDFLLGVGLCPTGKSQKTGRVNYIRENVYAAHSAPSLFTHKWVIIRLLLTSEKEGADGAGQILSIISLWKWRLLA